MYSFWLELRLLRSAIASSGGIVTNTAMTRTISPQFSGIPAAGLYLLCGVQDDVRIPLTDDRRLCEPVQFGSYFDFEAYVIFSAWRFHSGINLCGGVRAVFCVQNSRLIVVTQICPPKRSTTTQ